MIREVQSVLAELQARAGESLEVRGSPSHLAQDAFGVGGRAVRHHYRNKHAEPRLTNLKPTGFIFTMAIDTTITALADPTRRELLRRLATEPCRAGDPAAGFAIRRPAVVKTTRTPERARIMHT